MKWRFLCTCWVILMAVTTFAWASGKSNGIPTEMQRTERADDGVNVSPVVTDLRATIGIEIQLDDWPEETTWELRNRVTDVVVVSGGPYPDQENQLITESVAVADEDCFTFTIFDSFGAVECVARVQLGRGYRVRTAQDVVEVRRGVRRIRIGIIAVDHDLETVRILIAVHPVAEVDVVDSVER